MSNVETKVKSENIQQTKGQQQTKYEKKKKEEKKSFRLRCWDF